MKRQSSHDLNYYGRVHGYMSVKKSYEPDGAIRALSVRDVESGIIFPHIPRVLAQKGFRTYAKPNSVVVTQTGIQGIASAVLNAKEFWDALSTTYSVNPTRDGLAVTSDLLGVDMTRDMSPETLAAYLSSPVGRNLTRRFVYGVSNRHLRPDDLAGLPIPDTLKEFQKSLNERFLSFYKALWPALRLGQAFSLKFPKAVNFISDISRRNIILSPADEYRFDYSWYQFRMMRDFLAKEGFVELGTLIKIRKPQSVEKADKGVLVLGTRDLKPNVVMPRGEKPRIVEHVPKANWASKGELVVAEVGGEISVGTCAMVPANISFWKGLGFSVRESGIAVSADITILHPHSASHAGYISSFLNSEIGRYQLKALSFMTKQTRVRHYELGKVMIPSPEHAGEHSSALESLNDAVLGVRKIVDVEIPRALGFDAIEVMMAARPYLERVNVSPDEATMNDFA